MKLVNSLLFLSLLLSYSCNKSTSSSTETNMTDSIALSENKAMIPVSTCYMSSMGKDTFHLKVEKFENVVTGQLNYLFHEKDKQRGTFEGVLHGDTLLADYTFMSEGKNSTRQIAFIINDSTAIEGYGEVEERDGKMIIKNTSLLQFGSGLQLKKVSCRD